jgi:Protein of unknown function (DUF3300)
MGLQIRRVSLRVAGASGQSFNSPNSPFKRVAVGGVALLLLVGGQSVLAQGYSPYGGQYAQPYAPVYSQPQYRAPQAYAQPQYGVPQAYGQPQYSAPQTYGQQAYSQQTYAQATGGPAMNADQLEQLVAPIALYPDTLVAQVLAASAYPAQVVDADRWLQAQGNASPYQIAGGADVQNWDPSVKALTAFPQVLAEMDRNQQWMSDLGNAYYNQPQDVLEAVQVMRQRAQAAGNLQSTPQEQVSYDQGAIVLAPPTPQVVYVPQYNPWTAYGDPVTPYPGFNLLSAVGSFFTSTLGSSALQWGAGIAMAAFDHTPFGWLSWAVSWLGNTVLFNHSNYATHSSTVADWGVRGGGYHAFAGGSYGGYGGGYRGSAAQGYARQPERIAPVERAYSRPVTEAYNRAPAPVSRTDSYARPENRLAYGPSYYNGGGREYANGGGRGYSAPAQSYRQPTMEAYRSASESESFRAEKEPKSGGFHLFGGGNKERSFKEPSFKQPSFKAAKFKEPKAPKMSGGAHSSGGHSSGHSSGHHW